MEIQLGTKVKDITDGFTGIVTSRVEFLNGCVQYYVQPAADPKTGAAGAGYNIDVQSLKVVGKGITETYPIAAKVIPITKAKARTGGPRRGPQASK